MPVRGVAPVLTAVVPLQRAPRRLELPADVLRLGAHSGRLGGRTARVQRVEGLDVGCAGRMAQRAAEVVRWAFLVVVQAGGAAAGWTAMFEGANRTALWIFGTALMLTGMMFGPQLGKSH